MISDVLTVAKTMKLPNISVTPNIIIGTDSNFCMVSTIQIPSEIPRNFSAIIKNLIPAETYESVYKNSNVLSRAMLDNEYDMIGNEYYINIADEPVLENNIRMVFDHAMHSINDFECVLQDYDAGNMQDFRNILNMKVSDGHAWYKVNDMILSFYGSLISANSADKIYMTIYKHSGGWCDPPSLLLKCSVLKKKYTIDYYIKYRLL